MVKAYLNRIETAVPPHDVHSKFVSFAPLMLPDRSGKVLFKRMVAKSQINHRYSFLKPHEDEGRLDTRGFYRMDAFPDTAARMRFYREHALNLASRALDKLQPEGVTHLIVTTCTGFFAPGLDLEIIRRYGLSPSTERTMIGFMGCHAALHALKAARHIVRSEPAAKVLVLNLELCTIHLKQAESLEQLLSFLLFGDGCAASLISAQPSGIELQSFHADVLPGSEEHITWEIGRAGFDMVLSGKVPHLIAANLPAFLQRTVGTNEREPPAYWAIHPGGRSVLDAVQTAAELTATQMAFSRDILARYGNMSSPTVMFVLKEILDSGQGAGRGFALAFGPGLSIEAMSFAVGGRTS